MISRDNTYITILWTDLEKATSGASGACGHFVGNPAILRTFGAKCPVFVTEDEKRRVEDGDLRVDENYLR